MIVSEETKPKDFLEMYKKMLKIRFFNEREEIEAKKGNTHGYIHLYTGEEAIAVGVISALKKGDVVTSTHRAEGHFIAAGVPMKDIMAELFGRATGLCKGKAGPMSISAPSYGQLGANEVVGAGATIATGAGWAFSLMAQKNVAVCFFGDGAANQGGLYESLNMAALWKLPVIYLCENNHWAVDTSARQALSVEDVSARANGFGLPGVIVDGRELLNVYEETLKAVNRARDGQGPTLIEAKIQRWCGHAIGDPQWYYRSRDEVMGFRKDCPIGKFKMILSKENLLTEQEDRDLRARIEKEVEEAVQFALNSPWPQDTELFGDLYEGNVTL